MASIVQRPRAGLAVVIVAKVTIPRGSSDPRSPVLDWPGRSRRDLEVVPQDSRVLQRWGSGEPSGRVVTGDNLRVLAGLEPRSARLAYLDPPFFSGQRYAYRTRAMGSWLRVPSFEDRWSANLCEYLSFLDDRLRLVARALTDDGSLYVHLDASAGHYVKVLLDEILGAESFSRQIIWKIGWVSGFKSKVNNWVRNHDMILYYGRPGSPFHRKLLPHPEGYVRRAGVAGLGRPIDDVWLDIPSIQLMSFSGEKTGWATQKNEELLRRIIEASSDEGDLVLDPFCGAGTTAAAAHALGRRFVTIDESGLAVHLTRRRLLRAEASFTVEGETLESFGHVRAEAWPSLLGPSVRLTEVPEAEGPAELDWRGKIDGWWVSRAGEPNRPIWHVHRGNGRQPPPVALESPPLNGVALREELLVTAVDLVGRHYTGVVSRSRSPGAA